MNIQNLASIDNGAVDDVVISAMALLVEGEPCEASATTPDGSDDIAVAVYCDEQQQSAVLLRCTQALARGLTGRIFELAPEEIADSDVLDATGELVNVIAGNLRGLVDCPGTMTTPFFLDEAAFARFSTGARNSYRLLDGEMQVLRV